MSEARTTQGERLAHIPRDSMATMGRVGTMQGIPPPSLPPTRVINVYPPSRSPPSMPALLTLTLNEPLPLPKTEDRTRLMVPLFITRVYTTVTHPRGYLRYTPLLHTREATLVVYTLLHTREATLVAYTHFYTPERLPWWYTLLYTPERLPWW